LVAKDIDTERIVAVPLEIVVEGEGGRRKRKVEGDGGKEKEGKGGQEVVEVEEEGGMEKSEEEEEEGEAKEEEVYFQVKKKSSSLSPSCTRLRVRTPCLLPPLHTIQSIRVLPPRYVKKIPGVFSKRGKKFHHFFFLLVHLPFFKC
jgi:hypothetical protein